MEYIHVYQMLDMYIQGMHAHTYAIYKTLTSAMYTYFTYFMEQIWLPHSKYISHGQHTTWIYRPNIFAYIYILIYNQLQLLLHIFLQNMCEKLICPPIWPYIPYMSNTEQAYIGDVCTYMPHMKSLAPTILHGALYTL